MNEIIKKELKVAFSRKTQPLVIRIAKWTIFLGIAYLLRSTDWLWVWIIGAFLMGFVVHFTFRWKTEVWTKSWRGFNVDEFMSENTKSEK